MRPNRDEQVEELTKKLSLNEEQVSKVKIFFEEQEKEIEKMRSTMEPGDFGAMREKFSSMQKNLDDKIESILTDEQKIKFSEYKIEREKLREERRKSRGGGRW